MTSKMSGDSSIKTIYFEPSGRVHSSQLELIRHPPDGYRFITSNVGDKMLRLPLSGFLYAKGVQAFERIIPTNLVAGWARAQIRRLPHVDLIYSYNHPVFGGIPYVVFVEWVHVLIGRNIKYFKKYKKLLEDKLASNDCRGIITWSDLGRKAIEANLDAKKLGRKIYLVPLAVSPKHFIRRPRGDKTRLLFVGSIDAPEAFVIKGGVETLQAFKELVATYRSVELVVRARVPSTIKRAYQNVPNLRIIDNTLPWVSLAKEFESADIFVQPTHDTPFGAFLQAMSYGLPVLTRDAFVNSELVADGVTGFVIKSSRKLKYFWEDNDSHLIQVGATPGRNEFVRQVSIPDREIIDGLKSKILLLAEDKNLLRRMSESAKREVEEGRFSIKRRNSILKKVLDDAIQN